MKKNKATWLTLFGAYASISLFAQSPFYENLNSLTRLALEQHPQLKAAEFEYQKESERIPQQAALPDPRLSIVHFVESIETRTGPQKNQISLQQPIPWMGKRREMAAMASAQADSKFWQMKATELELKKSLAQAVVVYLYNLEEIERLDKALILMDKLGNSLESQIQGGQQLAVYLEFEIEKERLTDQRADAESQLANVRAQLRSLVGGQTPPWNPQSLELPTLTLELPPLESLFAASTNHPQIKRLDALSEMADRELALAELNKFPDFMIGINYIQTDERVGFNDPDNGKDPWAITFAVNIPLWRESRHAAVREKRFLEDQLQSTIEATQLTLNESIEKAYRNYLNAQRRHELYRDRLLPLTDQLVNQRESDYMNSRSSSEDYLDNLIDQIDFQSRSREFLKDSWIYFIELTALTNETLNF